MFKELGKERASLELEDGSFRCLRGVGARSLGGVFERAHVVPLSASVVAVTHQHKMKPLKQIANDGANK